MITAAKRWFRHRPWRIRSAWLAQEAKEQRSTRTRLIKTPDRISERPPQLAVFLFAAVRLVVNGT
jgi:hypothetical protein